MGCATPFGAIKDNTEYQQFISIVYLSTEGVQYCGKPDAGEYINQLGATTRFLEIYTKYIPDNDDTHNIAVILKDQVVDLLTHQKQGMSEVYCKEKLYIITTEAERSLQAIAQKRTN
jgi:hypothetical protein